MHELKCFMLELDNHKINYMIFFCLFFLGRGTALIYKTPLDTQATPEVMKSYLYEDLDQISYNFGKYILRQINNLLMI